MPGKERGTKGATGIAGGRLNPDVFKGTFSQNSAVADTVQGNPAREAEVFLPGDFVDVPGGAQHHFFGNYLDRSCQVHLFLRELGFRFSWRTAKQPVEFLIGHGQTDAVVEILHVQPVGAVFFEVHEVR